MMPAQLTSYGVVTLSSPDSEASAVQLGATLIDSELPAAGGAVSLMRVTLDDGEARDLVVYAIDPAEVALMASNADKRSVIAYAIQAAAQEL